MPPAPPVTAAMKREWISGRAACRTLGMNIYSVMKLAVIGDIRAVSPPGAYMRFHRGDVEKLARDGAKKRPAKK